MSNPTAARPFLKWAGGKTQLLPELRKYYPPVINRYFEPFLGGGAVFFDLCNSATKIRGLCFLSDVNKELIITYEWLAADPIPLVNFLCYHSSQHSSQHYYTVREQVLTADTFHVAARMIYLNKTCFNGLYRVNKNGTFNAPLGSTKTFKVDSENLLLVAKLLRDAVINHCHFLETVFDPQDGDFVYFDPPYDSLKKDSFKSYTQDGFTDEDQAELAGAFRAMDKRGCLLMLSNADTPFIRALYKDFYVHTVEARRSINSKGGGRAPVGEVIVTNYLPGDFK